MRIKPMPIVGPGQRVPRPVRAFKILEDNASFRIFVRRVAPDVKVPVIGRITRIDRALSQAGDGAPGFLKPRILIGSVIDHQLGDDAQPAIVRGRQKRAKILQRSKVGIDVEIVGNVIPIVTQGRGIKREQPDGGGAQLLQVVELLDQAPKITNAVAIAVMERLDVQLVDDRILVPKRIADPVLRLSHVG